MSGATRPLVLPPLDADAQEPAERRAAPPSVAVEFMKDGFEGDDAFAGAAIGALQLIQSFENACASRRIGDGRSMINLAEALAHGRHGQQHKHMYGLVERSMRP
ncbi:hypothetical protein Mext_2127 [Methylorubrum extorquens PA1]|nr:hypothetical protein Mext_2127 [Methylorubrum extorquens PA1]